MSKINETTYLSYLFSSIRARPSNAFHLLEVKRMCESQTKSAHEAQ